MDIQGTPKKLQIQKIVRKPWNWDRGCFYQNSQNIYHIVYQLNFLNEVWKEVSALKKTQPYEGLIDEIHYKKHISITS